MMHSKIDLNLFLVLKMVYQEGTITGAATKLHLTQPAVSHALNRLRSKFDDALFIRHGRKMIPSMLCQSVMPQVIDAVSVLESTMVDNQAFDVTQHNREIKLGLRDILESIFFPSLVADLITHTPNITINSRQVSRVEMESTLEQQERDIVIDVLTPTGKDIQHTLICNEHFSLICREGHPILTDLTLENYAKAAHALVALKDSRIDLVDMALAKHGVTRNIALQCEHYFAATSVISRSDMLLTMPNAYAKLLTEQLPVCVTKLPFAVPVLPVHMYWHKQAEQDPLNAWMRNKLLHIAKQLF